MPDYSVVEKEFVTQVGNILYTPGGYQPYSVATSDMLNQQFRLMRGWPVDSQLVQDLVAGIVNVTVFTIPGQRNTTRFLRQNMIQTVNVPAPTMTASLTGNQITFIGTASTNELIAVSIGDVAGMSIRLQANDTPTTVAQKFASGLPNATATAGTLTISTTKPLGIAIGCDVTMLQEVHRQLGEWKISIWAPTTDSRDQFCSLIDPALQGLDRFFFADGSCSGPIIGAGTWVDDVPEKQKLWRRDLHYQTEFPTDVQSIVPVMVLGELEASQFTLFTGSSGNTMSLVEGMSGSGSQGIPLAGQQTGISGASGTGSQGTPLTGSMKGISGIAGTGAEGVVT